MKTHMCMDIAGALRNRAFNGFTDDNGKKIKPKDAEMQLRYMLNQGKKVMPLGKCDNFDDQKGCLGHPDDELVSTTPQ